MAYGRAAGRYDEMVEMFLDGEDAPEKYRSLERLFDILANRAYVIQIESSI